MAYARSFKELVVWQRAMELVDVTYQLTQMLPPDERYVLLSQMRRCAISVPSNIAEGYKRRSLGDYLRFLHIADGSAAELETQVGIVRRQYPNLELTGISGTLEEVQKMLSSMVQKMQDRRN